MIEFSCVYCGQPVRVGDDLAHKQIGCPACGHTIRVRAAKPGEALRSRPAPTADASREVAERWSRMSDEEIREAVLVPAMPKAERRRRFFKRLFAPWLPRYDDLTLFAFSIASGMVVAVDPNLRESLGRIVTREWTDPLAVWFLLVAGGGLFSLVNVFFAREKSEFERILMLFFAVVVTVGTGFATGRPMLGRGLGPLAIFPLWNIANGLLLLILSVTGVLDDDCLTGERATLRQILLATVCISLLILACHYRFHLAPLATLSVAVAYTMSMHNVVRRLFGRWVSPARDS